MSEFLPPDVLTVRVLLEREYASKNNEGKDRFRDGPKSDSYVSLSDLMQTAAEAEMERIGWEMALCPCIALFVLYVPNRHRRDALNIGTAEANALTEAGVWEDDTLADIVIKKVAVDFDGPARVAVTVQKLFDPLTVGVKPTRRVRMGASEAPKDESPAPKAATAAKKKPGSIIPGLR